MTPETPLPWQHEGQDSRLCMRGCEKFHSIYIERSNPSHNVGGTLKTEVAANVEEQDAAFIVHACNSFPQMARRLDEFRDIILNQRGALAENGMTNDQVNDVLAEFDAIFFAAAE